MKRFAISLAAVVFALALASSVYAGGKNGNGGHHGGNQNLPKPVHHVTQVKKVLPAPVARHVNHPAVPPGHKHTPAPGSHHFLAKHAKKHHFGWCYTGSFHRHWTYSCWSPAYGCNIFWCPYACCYFYWCAPYGCYFPVTYCPTGSYAY